MCLTWHYMFHGLVAIRIFFLQSSMSLCKKELHGRRWEIQVTLHNYVVMCQSLSLCLSNACWVCSTFGVSKCISLPPASHVCCVSPPSDSVSLYLCIPHLFVMSRHSLLSQALLYHRSMNHLLGIVVFLGATNTQTNRRTYKDLAFT